MNEQKAKEILKDCIYQKMDGPHWPPRYICWHPTSEKESWAKRVALKGEFTVDEIEAIAWWMRHKK